LEERLQVNGDAFALNTRRAGISGPDFASVQSVS
jgi:hypothetical protein